MTTTESEIRMWRYDDDDAPADEKKFYEGAVCWKNMPDGKVIVMYDMMFNLRVCVGDRMEPVFDRGFCYPKAHPNVAFGAFMMWDGKGDPADGWIKEAGTHRRRPDGTPGSEIITRD